MNETDARSTKRPSGRTPVMIAAVILAVVAVTGALAVGLANQDEAAELAPPAPTGSLAQPPFDPFAAPTVEGVISIGEGVGERFSLEDLRGKPVVINFWASWCDPCRREAPDLVAFAASQPEVEMVGINVQDDEDRAPAFAEELGFAWPTIADPDGETMRKFKLAGLPGTFVVDAEGRVVFRKLGTVTADELREAVAT
jgi:cytochrome c biogenesis protein CcmG/thiol:disulfide interchange protein DsbE